MAKNSLRNLRDQLRAARSELGPLKDMSLPENWEENSLFFGCKDSNLRIVTQGLFPIIGKVKTLGTHPIFLLKRISNIAFDFCPNSTQSYNASTSRCIPKGTRLLHSVRLKETDKNSYILEKYTFKLVPNNIVVGPDNFRGIVPEDAIQRGLNNMGGGTDD